MHHNSLSVWFYYPLTYMIEANTVPGLSAESLIPQQAVAAGYTLPQFFEAWVKHGMQKST